KRNSVVDMAMLDHAVREHLNATTPRVMTVMNPLKVVIENYPEGQVEELDAPYNMSEPEMGTRKLPFARELYIERDDFMEAPPKKFFRLAPGREVRLRHAYYMTCQEVVKDEQGEIVALRCTYDPESRGGTADGRKVKGTLHWVSAEHAVPLKTRLYDRLFTVAEPLKQDTSFLEFVNPESLVETTAYAEPSVVELQPEQRVQFERVGYFVADLKDSQPQAPVMNRVLPLRDSWAKIAKSKS
ncbi:MAG: glutamine--tRNA ligase, partial [Myxococcota bacterium]